MTATKQWHIELFLEEEDGRTAARAVLHTRDTHVEGAGSARRNPRDSDVPEIGDELAAARALADLAHRLLDATIGDIEAVTGRALSHPLT